MTALSADRNTPVRSGSEFSYPVAAGARIFAGSIVVLSGGKAEAGKTATSLVIAGRAEAAADNRNGSDGDVRVLVRQGTFRWANSKAGDAISLSEVGKDCYLVDDQTVGKTNGSSSRSKAGRVVDVDTDGVWVRLG